MPDFDPAALIHPRLNLNYILLHFLV